MMTIGDGVKLKLKVRGAIIALGDRGTYLPKVAQMEIIVVLLL